MQNLAGHPESDAIVRDELRRCGIPSVPVTDVTNTGEVKYTVYGKLGDFEFHRAWKYWMVKGKVPLALAKELYENPVGKTDIRVNGDCTCPEPAGNRAEYFAPSGRKILDMKNHAEMTKAAESDSKLLSEIGKKGLVDYDFAENPEEHGEGFITAYHIDSELGLYIFAEAIRKL